MAGASTVSVVFDTTMSFADSRIRRELHFHRCSVVDSNGFLDEKDIRIQPNTSVTLTDVDNPIAFSLVSDRTVRVDGLVVGNLTPTTFAGIKHLSMTTGVEAITITNEDLTRIARVRVTRLGTTLQDGPISERQIVFAAFASVAAIGATVTNLNKVLVQDASLSYLANNQVAAPSAGLEAYRICDSNGTANATGAYIMYLNTTATAANSSGTLLIYFRETV